MPVDRVMDAERSSVARLDGVRTRAGQLALTRVSGFLRKLRRRDAQTQKVTKRLCKRRGCLGHFKAGATRGSNSLTTPASMKLTTASAPSRNEVTRGPAARRSLASAASRCAASNSGVAAAMVMVRGMLLPGLRRDGRKLAARGGSRSRGVRCGERRGATGSRSQRRAQRVAGCRWSNTGDAQRGFYDWAAAAPALPGRAGAMMSRTGKPTRTQALPSFAPCRAPGCQPRPPALNGPLPARSTSVCATDGPACSKMAALSFSAAVSSYIYLPLCRSLLLLPTSRTPLSEPIAPIDPLAHHARKPR